MKFDNLRYRLLPYIYSLAGRSTIENYTMMRSLAFDFRTDPKVYSIPDQYMFGPAFLVSPVTSQLYTGKDSMSKAKTRDVYLPAATQWYDFWTGKKETGGQTITQAVPLDMLPLYVKAGSIIPMGPQVEYATEKPNAPIELRIYPGTDGEFLMYEDEGENYNYEKGNYATYKLAWNDKARELTISPTKGSFNGMVTKQVFNVIMVNENNGIGGNVSTSFDKTIEYVGKLMTVKM